MHDCRIGCQGRSEAFDGIEGRGESMNGITPAQKRKIWILARQNGMDDELLHLYVSRLTKKSSIRSLTIMEAVSVIDALEGKERQPADHMSTKQEYYMKALAKELGMIKEDGSLDEKRLNGFCRGRYGVGSYSWLTRTQASRVIEGLKAMVERKEEAENGNKGN